MPEKKSEVPASVCVELPAVYSQGGFVQVRTIVMPTEEIAANDREPMIEPLPAS